MYVYCFYLLVWIKKVYLVSMSQTYETTFGTEVTANDILLATHAQNTVEDDDCPGPIGNAVNAIINGNDDDIKWDAAAENIVGPSKK